MTASPSAGRAFGTFFDQLQALRGWLTGSFVPHPTIRELRDLTRRRVDPRPPPRAPTGRQGLGGHHDRARSVASQTSGKPGRAMIEAFIAGERTPTGWPRSPKAARGTRSPSSPVPCTAASPPTTRGCCGCIPTTSTSRRDHRGAGRPHRRGHRPFRADPRPADHDPRSRQRMAEVIIAEVSIDMAVLPPPHIRPRGRRVPGATTNPPASAAPDAPGRATPGRSRRSRKPPGPPPAPRTATWPPRFGVCSRRISKTKAAVAVAHSVGSRPTTSSAARSTRRGKPSTKATGSRG